MAIKKDSETKLIVKVQTGTTTQGKASYSQRSFGNINPNITEDDIYDIGEKLAALQVYTLGSVHRQDLAQIAKE